MDRQKLQEAYVESIVEHMSVKELVAYAYDMMHRNMDEMPDHEFLEEVKLISPELLEG